MTFKSSIKKFYITTSIAYTNAKPHIGYALELVQADVLARYYREKLGEDKTFFLTGTDDHGTNIYQKARENNQVPAEFVAKNIATFKKLVQKLSISNNDFISTSDSKKHWPGAQALWEALDKSGDIYKNQYKGLYCVGCEAYLTKRDLVDGKCPNHLKEPEIIEEENYFFRLTKYTDKIIKLIKTDKLQVIPEERKNEVLNILAEMENVSFSRPKEKLPWGIPVPGDDSQIMYVWCDALSNYITALGYGTKNDKLLKKFWPAEVHCIGKDILKFHAVIWPAMLLSAGLSLPKKIFVHGHITSDGKKMSKSLGNVVDPFEIIEKYGADALRYYLLREIPSTGDGDFSMKRFEDLYNNELANELGNLLQRVIKLAQTFNIKLPKHQHAIAIFDEKGFENYLKDFHFNYLLENIWQRIRAANSFIESGKPWGYPKKEIVKISSFFENMSHTLWSVLLSIEPFLPSTAKKIQSQLSTLKPKPLFPRIK